MPTFPSTPTIGQQYTISDAVYQWTGSKWVIVPGVITNNDVISNDGAIDLSEGNYHIVNASSNTTISFANIQDGTSKWTVELKVTGNEWNLNYATYSQFFSVAGQDTFPLGIAFSADGSKMYILGNTNDRVYQYNLSTPWLVTSAVYSTFVSISTQDGDASGVFFKPDGTKMYVVGRISDTVHEYILSIPWNVSTAIVSTSKSIAAQDSIPEDIFFKPDGTRMYIVGNGTDIIIQYNLSTPWLVSSATWQSSASISGRDTLPTGIFMKPDGRKLYMLGSVGNNIYEYTLQTPWVLSSIVYSMSFSMGAQDDAPTSLAFSNDGSKMYVVGEVNDRVYEYTFSNVNPTVTWPSGIKWAGNVAPTLPASGSTCVIVDFYSPDGGTTIYGIQKFNNGA